MAATLAHSPKANHSSWDLERLSANGRRFELVRGELIEMSPTGFPHGIYTNRLASRVSVFAEDNDLGLCPSAETGFRIAQVPETVLAPDWAFVAKDRVPEPFPEGYLDLAPDIVLETVSPSDTAREVAQKVALWLSAGVRVVWVLDPRTKTLAVHRVGRETIILSASATLTEDELLPGFSFPIKRLFPKGR